MTRLFLAGDPGSALILSLVSLQNAPKLFLYEIQNFFTVLGRWEGGVNHILSYSKYLWNLQQPQVFLTGKERLHHAQKH